jgi:FkbM family methyltransferase
VQRLSPKVEEARLLETILELFAEPLRRGWKVAGLSTGRGQACETIARTMPESSVLLWYIDLYHSSQAEQQVAMAWDSPAQDAPTSDHPTGGLPKNLDIRCLADLEERDLDLCLVPLGTSGEQELVRDYLQQHFDALRIGGVLAVSVDNPKDRWVHELLKGYAKSVRVRPYADAMVYLVEKTHELKKRKDFSCELAFRDCDELIQLVTRPGVFSHRQLDNGARQLLDAVDVYPQARLIDIGCGSGSVALGLAKRDPSAHVHAVDANARALWCVQQGMQRNGLTNLTLELNATGDYRDPGTFDMALANPPYFGNYSIAEKFLQAAHRSLRTGGRLVLVTKQPKWYEENLPRWFHHSEVFASRRYHIASGVK